MVITVDRIGDLNVNETFKKVIFETANTADGSDNFTVTLSDYGCDTFVGINGWRHTTENSVVVAEAPTTAVANGVLTITTPAGNNNQKRVYEVLMR